MNSLRKCAALLGALFLASCAGGLSPGPLSSTPPAKSVVVNSEFSIGDGFLMKKFIYPAGNYLPIHEDSKAHYFAPPGEQIRVMDSGMSMGSQGGIYWEKGREAPRKVYASGNFGIKLALNKEGMPIQAVR